MLLDLTEDRSPADAAYHDFTRERLEDLAQRYAGEFEAGVPFPHVVIEDFLPLHVAQEIASQFPRWDRPEWALDGPGNVRHSWDPAIEKVSSSDEMFFPPPIRQIMRDFNSGVFLDFVARLTGFSSLVPDPWYSGCGLHSTGRGGRLMIHADQSRHTNPKLHQIINMIYYATPDWQQDWGGALELWDHKTKTLVKKIYPKFNSVVLFYTGPRAYHGHPHPLQTPEGVRRNSLAVYYYTTDRSKGDQYDGRQENVKWISTNKLDNNISWKRKAYRSAMRLIPLKIRQKAEAAIRRAIQEG